MQKNDKENGDMSRFSGCLLVSDLDGTLIGREHHISPENIAAIRTFVAGGGRFLGATGRTELNVRPYTVGIPLSSPWILYNGAAIYDWSVGGFLYKAPLDRHRTEAFVRRVMARLPGINIQVYPGGPFCQVNPTGGDDITAVREGQAYEDRPMEEIVDDWLKVLFCTDHPEEIDIIEAMFDADPLSEKAHKTHSGSRYFELTAPGVNKGSALARLRSILDPTPSCVVAIGDYINDVEMLQEADIPAAPDSALDVVKRYARIVTRSHAENAIADLVDRLANGAPLTANI